MARATLERARLRNPRADELWLESVRLERHVSGNEAVAESTLARALKDCPTSGRLWAEAIEMAPRAKKKALALDAHTACADDAHVLVAIARLFVAQRKAKKARSWFARVVKLHPEHGDGWIHAYNCELAHGTPAEAAELLARVDAAEPRYGEHWIAVSKAVPNFALRPREILLQAAASLHDSEPAEAGDAAMADADGDSD